MRPLIGIRGHPHRCAAPHHSIRHEGNDPLNLYFYETSIGRIAIAEEDGSITNLYLPTDPLPDNPAICETDRIKEAYRQICQYLSGSLKQFRLPLNPAGTPNMKRIWEHLCTIPYGETRTYKQIADACGNPGGARAAGSIIARNPIPIIIPCHRVIGSNGLLTGYRGGLELKRMLINLERENR